MRKRGYYRVKRMWEVFGKENETFSSFIFRLELEGIITFKEWLRLSRVSKYDKKKN